MCKGTVRDVMNNMFLFYTSLTTYITTLHTQKFERILFFLKLQLQETLNVMLKNFRKQNRSPVIYIRKNCTRY